jgi:formylglycine-generating enzyme required for sulfatase activity
MARILAAILLLLLTSMVAQSQTMVYPGGSVHDLDLPLSESLGEDIAAKDMEPLSRLGQSDLYRRLGKPVGRLLLKLESGKLSSCTGSLITPELVLTASHCLHKDGEVSEAKLWMGYLVPRSKVGVSEYRVILDPVEENQQLDYVVLRVSGRPGTEWGTVKFAAPELLANQSLFVIHHPAGSVQYVTRGKCHTGDPATDGVDLLHGCDTLPGSSGAPIFDNEARAVIGLHTGKVDLEGTKRGKRIAGLAEESQLIAALVRPSVVNEQEGLGDCRQILVRVGSQRKCLTPGDVFQDCPDCPKMVVIPAGKFIMGSPASEKGRIDNEGPQREVTIRKPFAIGKFEITRGEFAAFVSDSGYDAGDGCWRYEQQTDLAQSSFRTPGFEQTDEHPVVCIDWADAVAYVVWLTHRTGKHYRLLTEAEWEYAARAGSRTRFHFGDAENGLCDVGNGVDQDAKRLLPNDFFSTFNTCSDGFIYTAPVGSFSPNDFGIHDLHGNAGEWVEDCLVENYSEVPDDGSAQTLRGCNDRVRRGGSWADQPAELRSAHREWSRIPIRNYTFGFRIARTLNP